jgi:hypothetical protein
MRANSSRFSASKGAAVRANLVGIEAIDVGLAVTNQSDGKLVQALEVVRGEIQAIPLKAEPLDVLFDGVDVLDVFLRRVRVVEPEVTGAVGFFGDAEIETDRLGVADVKIAVRLRWKAGGHTTRMFAGRQILGNDGSNEIDRHQWRGRTVLIGHPASILSWLGRTSWLARSAILSETSQRPIAALESVRHEQPRGPLDLSVAGKIELLERRRIRDRRIQRSQDPNGSIETLEGLFLNQCRETLTDAAGP